MPSDLDEATGRALLQEAAIEGVQAQLWQRWRTLPSLPHWCSDLSAAVRQRALWELSHGVAMAQVLDELDNARVDALVLKGTALAYAVYTDPAERARGDTDLLIAAVDRSRVDALLRGLGFTATIAIDDHSSEQTQLEYRRLDTTGALHCIDLHWAPLNTLVLDGVWACEDLRRRAKPIRALSASAKGLSRPDAYLHACLHWACNRHVPYRIEGTERVGGDRLIWLLDLQKLAQSLTPTQLDELTERARSLGVAGLCREATRSAQLAWPDPTLQQLAEQFRATKLEWRSLALRGGWFRRGLAEAAISARRGRLLPWLRSHLWRDAGHLRQRYPDAADSPLWRLQLRRWMDGIRARVNR
ncbi:MAG: nucleotidyltransferase family protein [Xanthomonadales bacterium]|nr:nucleotidyltransferase family protein [Xanthomonadales bacterium]